MKLRTILASLVIAVLGCAQAQPRDEVLLQMQEAFRRGDTARLAQLLPQAQGHALEPWAAYWEMNARLESASPEEIRQVLARYAGTYQEDRLRNDWLRLLGERREWDTFLQEYPKFRMNDDREVRCYALLAQATRDPGTAAAAAAEVRKLWLSLRDADDGCTLAAGHLMGQGGPGVPRGDLVVGARRSLGTVAVLPRFPVMCGRDDSHAQARAACTARSIWRIA